ncbi:MAG: rod shape-determining protein MreD [Candidatus Eremiobacteraeota bacterium]|nr:rod shape-determining protein MreD [Candidatus Eremiobacteraeota bacterium]
MSLSRSKSQEAPFTGPSWQRAAIYLAIALLVQNTVLHFFSWRDATISPVLVVVVWYAMRTDVRRGAILGLAAGFVEDMLGAGTGGAWTIATTLTAIIASVVSRGFFEDSIPLVGGVVIFCTLVRNLIFWLVMQAQGFPPGLGWMHFHRSLWQAALNALFVVVAMVIARHREHHGVMR